VTLFTTVEGLYESPSVRWAMDDRTNTATVRDSAGSNPQTFIDATGNPFTQKHSVNGYNGPALKFDGIDDVIVLTDNSNHPFLAKDADFTISFWWACNSPNPAASPHIFSNYLYPNAGIRLATVSNHFRMTTNTVYASTPHSFEWIDPTTINNNWHFWTFTRNGSVIDFYKDGVRVAEEFHIHNNEALYTAGRPTGIGQRPGSTLFSPGAIQDFRIYSKCLTPGQVADLYNV
jgi:hypothetical protein